MHTSVTKGELSIRGELDRKMNTQKEKVMRYGPKVLLIFGKYEWF